MNSILILVLFARGSYKMTLSGRTYALITDLLPWHYLVIDRDESPGSDTYSFRQETLVTVFLGVWK